MNPCGYRIVAIPQPSKLKLGVRFSLPAPTTLKENEMEALCLVMLVAAMLVFGV